MKGLIKILLIEDSDDDAELIELELTNYGFDISLKMVDNRSDLINALSVETWDIVLSDYVLPEFNGLDALKMVRNHSGILPFILVSGAMGEKKAVELMRMGADDYILKDNLPWLPRAVSGAIEKAEAKRRALRDQAELEDSNRRLTAIYHGTTDVMSLLRVEDGDFIYESVNKAYLEGIQDLFGPMEYEDIVGLTSREFLSKFSGLLPEKIEAINKDFLHVAQTGRAINFIDRYEMEPTPYIGEIHLNPIINKGKCTHILMVARDVTETKLNEERIKVAYEEVARLKERLEGENRYLKEELEIMGDFADIIFKSKKIKRALKLVEQVAPVDTTVLVTGETGTGKELIVRAIHKLSTRKAKPFIKVNCAALPKDLIESELFGHEKGAFTGADKLKLGRFELADKGTIFLDEIGELPIDLQAKLLRVLQENEIERLGGSQSIPVDVRVITATNKDLGKEIMEGRFREDLYYRLEVFPIHIPPLRERPEDIAPLVAFFVEKYNKKFQKSGMQVPSSELSTLQKYPWPGNVRELENLVERAMILAKDNNLSLVRFLGAQGNRHSLSDEGALSLMEVEKNHITRALHVSNWKINGTGGAAELLGLTPSTLRDRMKKHGIRRPEPSPKPASRSQSPAKRD